MATSWLKDKIAQVKHASSESMQPGIKLSGLPAEVNDPRSPETLQLELSRLRATGKRLRSFFAQHGVKTLDDAYDLLKQDRSPIFGDGFGRASRTALTKLFLDYGYDIKSLGISWSVDWPFPES